MQVFILDDDEQAVELLIRYVERTPELTLAGAHSDAREALQQLAGGTLHVDVLLLDVEMPGITGIEIAKQVKDKMQVVFVSGFRGYAKEAYDLNLTDYLLKPVTYVRFLETVARINERRHLQELQERKLTLNDGGKGQLAVVNVCDITYMVSASNHVHIYFTNRPAIKIRAALQEFEQQLHDVNFMRVHKSYLVNLAQVKRIDGTVIQLANNGRAELARNKRDEFMQRIGNIK